MKLLHLVLCDELSQSTKCGGITTNDTFHKENLSSLMREFMNSQFPFERLDTNAHLGSLVSLGNLVATS